ncbi:DNA mismatch repair protein MutL [Candidatus Pantoea carbekii]|nr:DNA mismatch repair protein MutL [Candidatus Pantoea carbekii]
MLPIKILSPQLISQISAGEVVDRPASVVKELLENSLDAGATRINIEIEKGGTKLIYIRDNGCGIPKSELAMALERYATSKISSLEDLENIISFGFRGEALAAISAVSRLTLTSRTSEQDEGWQSYIEGNATKIMLKPVAHPIGTSLKIFDLFYNTPARRKFMRTDKTEFMHIDAVIRHIALARFDVTISLSHNGKLMRQYHSVSETVHFKKRLRTVCGINFVRHALRIDRGYNSLSLNGWLANWNTLYKFMNLKYCYVNGRMINDHVINHAIKQAYQTCFGDNRQASYVLYLNLEPNQIDVNVHPAKREIRFYQTRFVHDFIYQAIVKTLQSTIATHSPIIYSNNQKLTCQPINHPLDIKNNDCTQSLSSRILDSSTEVSDQVFNIKVHQQKLNKILLLPSMHLKKDEKIPEICYIPNFGRLLSIVQKRYALLEQNEIFQLLSLATAACLLQQTQFQIKGVKIEVYYLLIPITSEITIKQQAIIDIYTELLSLTGINVKKEDRYITLFSVPFPLQKQNLQFFIPALLDYLEEQKNISISSLIEWLANYVNFKDIQWNQYEAILLLEELSYLRPELLISHSSNTSCLVKTIDIEKAIKALQNE